MANVSVNYDINLKKIKYRELKSPIVFVVDMVNGFIVEGNMADNSILEIVPDIKKLLDNVKPSIFICDAHDLDANEFNSFPIHCVKNTHESKVIDELQSYAKTIFEKNSTNAFVNDKIKNYIKENIDKYNDFIICGCCSDICILQFALSLRTYFNENNLSDKRVIVPINTSETYHNAIMHDQFKYNEFSFNLMKQSGIIIDEIGE